MKKYIATHNGNFHADDTMAVAIIKLLFTLESDIVTVRTRDPQEIADAAFVVDVGGVYDPDKNRFDHHQAGAPVRPNGVPYAAAGLVWHKYGEELCQILSGLVGTDTDGVFGDIRDIVKNVDETLIQPIDAADNGFELMTGGVPVVPGISPLSFSGVIAALNPAWHQAINDQFDCAAFARAVAICTEQLLAAIARAGGVAQINSVMATGKIFGKHILVLPRYCPWQEAVLKDSKYDDILYVIFPDREGTWMCQCVPQELNSFAVRKPLPEKWAGLRDAELQAVTAESAAIFCHNGRFICGSRNEHSALMLAELAVMHNAV